MAKDTVELLDHLNWKEERNLHVIGVSMGGMIAQELVRSHFHRPRIALSHVPANTTLGHAHPNPHLLIVPNVHCGAPSAYDPIPSERPQQNEHAHPQISRSVHPGRGL